MSEQQEARSALLAARYARAKDTVTTIAAPLLASGGLGLIGVVAAGEDKFRWPGQALLLVTLAAILLVSCGHHPPAARTPAGAGPPSPPSSSPSRWRLPGHSWSAAALP
ncbi:hypothetical protein ACWD4J_02975 [Streptomyces sp. NPDC002577]